MVVGRPLPLFFFQKKNGILQKTFAIPHYKGHYEMFKLTQCNKINSVKTPTKLIPDAWSSVSTFVYLADSFIQSDLQLMLSIVRSKSQQFQLDSSGNQTHNLAISRESFNHWATQAGSKHTYKNTKQLLQTIAFQCNYRDDFIIDKLQSTNGLPPFLLLYEM